MSDKWQPGDVVRLDNGDVVGLMAGDMVNPWVLLSREAGPGEDVHPWTDLVEGYNPVLIARGGRASEAAVLAEVDRAFDVLESWDRDPTRRDVS